MSSHIVVQWVNGRQTAILMVMTQGWTWADLERAAHEVRNLLNTVKRRVDVIIDLRTSSAPPSGAIWRMRRMAEPRHPNRGRLIYVGASPAVRSLINLLIVTYSSVFRAPEFIFVDSVEAARAYIEDHPHTV